MRERPTLVVSVILLATLTAVLCGCSSSGNGSLAAPTTQLLVVADGHNNRVLIYDLPISTGQSANVVLGQADFTTGTAGTTSSTMNNPGAIALDSAGNLYLADDLNCRVTRFAPPFSNGMSANLVFGQPNLSSGSCAEVTSASSLGNSLHTDQVVGATIDSGGDLWVADSGSNRVLEYLPPFSDGMAATVAIGQASLTSGSPNQGVATPTNTTLSDPVFPVFDSSGNLWISDWGNNRVLEFKPPFATGMAASLVLGQPDFTHGSPNEGGAVGANTLNANSGANFDSSGNLWLADDLNNRVLEFEPPFTTNMNASLVLGQPDFTHGSANQGGPTPTDATLTRPHQVSFDSSGRLFVPDSGNNRTLVFMPPFSSVMSANVVIGQANFTSAVAATTSQGQNFPIGLITAK